METVDIFLVGSDQMWNYQYIQDSNWGHYSQLDFAGEGKRKISYVSSFGTEGLEPPAAEYGMEYRTCISA